MNRAYDETGVAFNIGARFASGGQGVLSRLDGVATHCIKVYHKIPDYTHVQKLRLLRSKATELSKIAALPSSLAFTDAGQSSAIGIFLPYVEGQEVFELYGTRSRLQHFPKANFKFLVHTAYNLATAFEDLHRAGIIVGDVNEQNVKVLPDATLRLIDCDSFQICNGSTVFTSDVGTPLWTPPELQEKNLTGLRRNENHDLFGLAQLVFLLLFTGRHPFSGVPRGTRQLQPEEAIREQAFAFAPAKLGLPLSPPPGCPTLNSVPSELQQCFMRAFLKGSEQTNARPTASEWKGCLERLLHSLAACARHPSHVFWKGASTCPWCSVIQDVGVDIFPPAAPHIFATSDFELRGDAYLSRLSALRSCAFTVFVPSVVDGLTPSPLRPPPTGFWSSIHKTLSLSGWKKSWLGSSLKLNQQQCSAGEASLRRLQSEQQIAISVYNQTFTSVRAALQPLLRQLSNPLQIRREIETAVASDRQRIELGEFLELFQLRRASIPNIGPGRKATLQSYGIETAADVSAAAVGRIPGFGPSRISGLLAWRWSCESHFKFDPSKPGSAALKQECERRIQEKIKALKEGAAKCETLLNQAQKHCAETLRKAQAAAIQFGRQRDQAKVNIAPIESEIRRI